MDGCTCWGLVLLYRDCLGSAFPAPYHLSPAPLAFIPVLSFHLRLYVLVLPDLLSRVSISESPQHLLTPPGLRITWPILQKRSLRPRGSRTWTGCWESDFGCWPSAGSYWGPNPRSPPGSPSGPPESQVSGRIDSCWKSASELEAMLWSEQPRLARAEKNVISGVSALESNPWVASPATTQGLTACHLSHSRRDMLGNTFSWEGCPVKAKRRGRALYTAAYWEPMQLKDPLSPPPPCAGHQNQNQMLRWSCWSSVDSGWALGMRIAWKLPGWCFGQPRLRTTIRFNFSLLQRRKLRPTGKGWWYLRIRIQDLQPRTRTLEAGVFAPSNQYHPQHSDLGHDMYKGEGRTYSGSWPW